MRPSLAIHANQQSGLVTRTQAVQAGYTERELRTLTGHRGAWVVVRRGVYMARTEWEDLGHRDGHRLLRALAAHLVMTRDHVLSHTSAGLIHRLPMLRVADDLVHVTRPGVTGSRTEGGVKHHRAHYLPSQVVRVGGVPVHDLARTAVDIGREHGYLHGLVACDAARQQGVTYADLVDAIEPMRCWPHVTRTRAAVLDSNGGAESVGETLARDLVASLGLGPVHTQHSVIVGGRVHFIDLRVGRHLIEFDGRIKYQRPAEGGVADQAPGDVVWAEKQREARVCAEGYGMSRLIWDDLWGATARHAAADRIMREHAVTTERHGTALPEGYRPVVRRQQVRRAS
jgi:hypothetical protein